MAEPKILGDSNLIGNDAAEDESPSILASYFVDKPEFKAFRDSSQPFLVVKARKGVGKSALLAYTRYTIDEAQNEDALVVQVTGSDLARFPSKADLRPDQLVFDWQQRICALAVMEIGKRVGIPMNDDDITAMEVAAIEGFRGRNLLMALVDRVKTKWLQVSIERQGAPDSAELLQRLLENKDGKLWVIVDDVDATFVRDESEARRVASFFSACRDLTRDVSGLVIRASVRSDVWPFLRRSDESLDKVEQYIQDISWSSIETKKIIAERIRSYYNRYGISAKHHASDTWYIEQVFERQYLYNKRMTPAHQVMHSLAHGRPRWAIQLWRSSASTAAGRNGTHISFDDIVKNEDHYGRDRINDLMAEHSHQSPDLSEMIAAFRNQPSLFKHDELMRLINNHILEHMRPNIDGVVGSPGPRDIGAFLFRIGFLQARRETDGGFQWLTFEEEPDLLTSRVNPSGEFSWEIHPCYRVPLGTRSPAYQERQIQRGRQREHRRQISRREG